MRTIKDAELFNALREYFKVYLPKQKQVSPNTIRSYQNALESLLDYIVKTIPIKLNEVTFDTIDKEIVCNYLDWLENECNCSKSTRNHRLRCIKAFYAFVADTIPTAAIYQKEIYKIRQAPVEKSTKLDYMSEEAVKAVLSAPDLNTSKGIRDALIMIMLYDTGARIQETLAIKLCDIQYRSATVTLSGKGRKVRCVKWNEVNREKLSLYYDTKDKPDVPIEKNTELRSLKNMLIRTALSMDFNAQMTVNHARIGFLFSMLAKQIVNSAGKRLDELNKMMPLTDSKEREKIRDKKIAHGQKEGSDSSGINEEVYDSQAVEGILTMLDYLISLGNQENEQAVEEPNAQPSIEYDFDNAYTEYLNDGNYDEDDDYDDEEEYYGLSM